MGLESILLWNCRGIVSQERQRALINIVQQRKPTLVFLSETMAQEQHIKSLAMKLGFAGSFCVPSDEGCQGLTLLWTAETQIIIRTHSFHHIDVEIGDSEQPPQFRFTGIYGWDARADRWKTWELIRKLGDEVCDLPWLMGGDFNEVLCRADKSGGAPRATAAMLEFRRAMVDCALSDMGFLGSRYTWSKKFIKERLYRCFQTLPWKKLIPFQQMSHSSPKRLGSLSNSCRYKKE